VYSDVVVVGSDVVVVGSERAAVRRLPPSGLRSGTLTTAEAASCSAVELGEWSWGESNPRPPSSCRPRYDRSRVLRLCGCRTAGSVGLARRPPPGLSPMSAVFPAASGLSRRQSSLLLPGCGDQAPRAITGRWCSRSPGLSGGDSELLIGSCVCAPFKESEQLRSHDSASGLDVETDQPLVKQPDECTGDRCPALRLGLAGFAPSLRPLARCQPMGDAAAWGARDAAVVPASRPPTVPQGTRESGGDRPA
jgi:hypothetical protein